MAKIGTTVRIRSTFRDFDGNLVDPTGNTATLKVYDGNKNIFETKTCTRESLGVYYFDYVVPAGPFGPLYTEISGVVAGVTILERTVLKRTWV